MCAHPVAAPGERFAYSDTGYVLLGHIEVTSTHLFVDPERDLHLALNLHSTREMVRSFRLHIDLVRLALRPA